MILHRYFWKVWSKSQAHLWIRIGGDFGDNPRRKALSSSSRASILISPSLSKGATTTTLLIKLNLWEGWLIYVVRDSYRNFSMQNNRAAWKVCRRIWPICLIDFTKIWKYSVSLFTVNGQVKSIWWKKPQYEIHGGNFMFWISIRRSM